MNTYISTVIIARMTTASRSYPSRVKKLGEITIEAITAVKSVIREMLED
jgi:hypothetical protein